MTHFYTSGNTVHVSNGTDVREELPAGNYVLKTNPFTGFFLEKAESFTLPSKIYGKSTNYCQRILNTFQERSRNTGVLLVGEKGSGKTLLMRQVAIASGLPVIIINTDFCGDEFNSFLTSITQPCIVLFDEFEKIYDKNKQERVLTLLDGTYQSNKLFIITSNNKWGLDANLKNRPGRIYYMFEYSGLDEDFIVDYCNDNLNDKSKIQEILSITKVFDEFNFDLLAAFVEELNRYNETPQELIKILNAKPEYCNQIKFMPQLSIGNHLVTPSALRNKTVDVNPEYYEFEILVDFCWDGVNMDPKLNDEIRSKIDYSEATIEELVNWLDNGIIAFGKSSDQWGADRILLNDYSRFYFNANDLIRYEGNSIFFKNENGFCAQLTRSNRRR
jgi:hypothetical protein